MKWILGLVFLMVASVGHADVTGTVIGYTPDENGNIIVKTAYYLDGVNVPSRYPMEGGKYYWVTRYSFQNFDGLDAKGIEARVQQDVDAFAESLIAKKYTAEENAKLDLSGMIGKSFTSTTTDIQVSPTKALTVSTTGFVSEKAISPSIAVE
jgi:hypothetical protein